MNRDVLTARIGQLEDELRTIHSGAGDRALTSAEQGRWNRLDSELREVRTDLDAIDAAAAHAAERAADRARWGSLQVGGPTGSTATHSPADVARMGSTERRAEARRILDDQKRSSGHLTPEQGDRVDALLRSTDSRNTDGDVIATMMLLSETDDYRSAFQRLIVEERPILTGPEVDALRAFQSFRAMSIGTDSAGGVGVPVLIDPTILLTGQQSGNPVRQIARVETITTDAWKGVTSAGVTWSWDGEAATVSDDSPTLVQPTVTTHKAQGFVPYSIEVGQDYPNFAREITGLLAEGYDELTAAAFVTGLGDGSNQPVGILTALEANTTIQVAVTTDGTFTTADIDKVWTALPDRAKGNATWLMSSDVESYIAAWGDAYGGRTADLASNLTTLRGRPHVTSTYMDAFTGTTGAASILIVGDFRKGYLIAQRAGLAVETVPHLFDVTNNRPTGQRGLFAWARVGADSIDDTAFRLLVNEE